MDQEDVQSGRQLQTLWELSNVSAVANSLSSLPLKATNATHAYSASARGAVLLAAL